MANILQTCFRIRQKTLDPERISLPVTFSWPLLGVNCVYRTENNKPIRQFHQRCLIIVRSPVLLRISHGIFHFLGLCWSSTARISFHQLFGSKTVKTIWKHVLEQETQKKENLELFSASLIRLNHIRRLGQETIHMHRLQDILKSEVTFFQLKLFWKSCQVLMHDTRISKFQ